MVRRRWRTSSATTSTIRFVTKPVLTASPSASLVRMGVPIPPVQGSIAETQFSPQCTKGRSRGANCQRQAKRQRHLHSRRANAPRGDGPAVENLSGTAEYDPRLAGGGMIHVVRTLPISTTVETGEDIRRYVKSLTYSGRPVKTLKLAWDAVGSEFAGRHDQYEKVYAGAPLR